MNEGIDVLAVRNPFRAKFMREAFDNMVDAYSSRSPLLFAPDGKPHRGNSWAGMFWRGYEGSQVGVWDRASKQNGSYPVWRAGKEVRAALARVGGAK
jgi:hypothetical protein